MTRWTTSRRPWSRRPGLGLLLALTGLFAVSSSTPTTWAQSRPASGPRGPHRPPNLDRCDPNTPIGWNTRVRVRGSVNDAAVEAPWKSLAEEAQRAPGSIPVWLDLARCYVTFYQGMNDPEGIERARSALNQALTLMRTEAANAGPVPPPAPTRGLPRAGVDLPLAAKTRDAPVVYPGEAMRKHRTGIVFVDATVGRDGKVSSATVVGSIEGLDRAALEAVRAWQFAPTLVDGKAVEVLRLVTVKFGGPRDSTAVDSIDVARFRYAQGATLSAASTVEQAIASLPRVTAGAGPTVPVPDPPSAAAPTLKSVRDINGTPPTVSRSVKPVYTPAAMDAKLEGEVRLDILIQPDGTVGDVRIRQSLDPLFGLDQEAVRVARQWTFTPARMGDVPVSVVAELVISFNLR